MSKPSGAVAPLAIDAIADAAGLTSEELSPYGRHAGKVDSAAVLGRLEGRPRGLYVAVTGMTPTPLGEGKTLTAIGLSMALNRLGTRTIATLRQPSMGPVFGLKGGASGSGASQIIPGDLLNLHCTGDIHAVTAAHNLLAAVIDSQLVQDNPKNLDPLRVTWPRVVDLNDRALRHVITGLGGREHGHPRESRFDITATSEIMAVLSLARDFGDLKRRLGSITVGLARDERRITVADLGVVGAMAAVLRDAFQPNLLQTSEHTPVLIHTGPFANISHGNSSVNADLVSLKLAECTVTEAGFGADLGLEKLIHLKCPVLGVYPDVAVLVCTVRALKFHSGHYAAGAGRSLDPSMREESLAAVEDGAVNLRQHIENVRAMGIPVVVAVNRMTDDTEAELALACRLAREAGATDAQVSSAWAEGSSGALDLGRAVLETARLRSSTPAPMIRAGMDLPESIHIIATRMYGARDVQLAPAAASGLRRLQEQGLDRLPVCMAKTHLSFSDDPRRIGRPRDFSLAVHELRPFTGAGYVTALCGDIMTMPGLPRAAAVYGIDVTDSGEIVGLS